jgi:hypothetical protein
MGDLEEGDWTPEGWVCAESPTKRCQYNDELDPAHDDCIHCGQPEERK